MAPLACTLVHGVGVTLWVVCPFSALGVTWPGPRGVLASAGECWCPSRSGITHIVSLNGGPVHRASFVYLTVELRDSPGADLLSVVPTTNCFIEAGRRHGGVLVHW